MESGEPALDERRADTEALFLANLALIERLLASVAHRHCFQDDEAEDFFGWAKLKLIENDYRTLGKYRGDSRLSTFLTTVLLNLARDYRVHERGKWRPSSKARRHGKVAEQLETLLFRDGRSLEEAVEILRVNYRVEESREELRELAAELPDHRPRRFTGEEELAPLESAESAEDRLVGAERETQVRAAQDALGEALSRLPAEDKVIVRLRFEEGLTVARISQLLDTKQQGLYKRIARILRQLRSDLESQDVRAEALTDLLGWEGWPGEIGNGDEPGENRETGPSTRRGGSS